MSDLILMPGDSMRSNQDLSQQKSELVIVQGNPSSADIDKIAKAAMRSIQNVKQMPIRQQGFRL